MRISRRNLLAASALTPVLAGLTSCGAAQPPAADADPDPTSGPITVSHKFGETTLPSAPTRVVTLGWNDQDFVLALGVVPVGVRSWFETYDDLPWVKPVAGGTALPVVAVDEYDYEKIAAARPDLILAIYDSVERDTYDRLSKLAPTVVQSADSPDEETPWHEQLLLTGRALGREAQALSLQAVVEGKVAAAIEAHPDFAGTVLVEDYGPENGGHYLIGAGDPRRAIFDALGFAAQQHRGELSEERLSELDHDVLFVVGATPAQMQQSELFGRLDVVAGGRTLYTTFESTLAAALSYSGPKALEYALDVLVPQLANAVSGKPVEDLSNA